MSYLCKLPGPRARLPPGPRAPYYHPPMADAHPPVFARRRLVDDVVRHLQQEISLGRWAAGSRLPAETELTQSLGVSRTTLREAVAALSHAGLLDVRRGDGTYVRPGVHPAESLDQRLRRAAILHVYEVRRALEVEAARLAAERRSTGDVATLRRLMAERDDARAQGDRSRAVERDVEFHVAVAVASGNPVLADVYRALAATLRPTLESLADDPTLPLVDTTKLHHDLVQAIEAKDATAAARVARKLLDADADVLRRAAPATPPRRAERRAPPADRRRPAR